MRSRTSFFLLAVIVICAATPFVVHAGGIPFFGPIIGNGLDNRCPLGWAALITVINNLISFGITIALLFVAPIMIAYSGFLLVVNPFNAGGKDEAKKILLNTVVGLVIALCSWLIVDAIMAVLYDPSEVGKNWSALVSSGGLDACIKQNGALVGLNPSGGQTPGFGGLQVVNVDASGTVTAVGADGTNFSFQSGVSAQLGMASPALKNIMGCIAATVPKGVGQVSAITEKAIAAGTKTMQQCAASGCAHAKNSCHYGGTKCVGMSYAVDYGDEQNMSTLEKAAKACDGGAWINNEGNHLHVSVGAQSGCGCDESGVDNP